MLSLVVLTVTFNRYYTGRYNLICEMFLNIKICEISVSNTQTTILLYMYNTVIKRKFTESICTYLVIWIPQKRKSIKLSGQKKCSQLNVGQKYCNVNVKAICKRMLGF